VTTTVYRRLASVRTSYQSPSTINNAATHRHARDTLRTLTLANPVAFRLALESHTVAQLRIANCFATLVKAAVQRSAV
jgi:flavin-binding protein dodecin